MQLLAQASLADQRFGALRIPRKGLARGCFGVGCVVHLQIDESLIRSRSGVAGFQAQCGCELLLGRHQGIAAIVVLVKQAHALGEVAAGLRPLRE